MTSLRKSFIYVAIAAILVLIVFPMMYVGVIDTLVSHKKPVFISGWECSDFTDGWRLASSVPVKGELVVENGVLKVTANESLPYYGVVTAQKLDDFVVNVTTYNYLVVSVKTSSVFTAARIVVWPHSTGMAQKEVLLKTYDDNEWHTEVVDLSSIFGLSGDIVGLELGFKSIDPSVSSQSVCFKQLSFSRLEV